MRLKLRISVCLTLLLALLMGMQTNAAGQAMTIVSCLITGDSITVTATGTVAASDDGNYYLFALQPYETGIGTRTDYCAVTAKAATVTMVAPLYLGTANSNLYARFQIAVLSGGKYVPASNEYYVTNPEAVATKTIAAPAGSKKGITLDWRFASDLSALGCGYALYEMDLSRFYNAGGFPYTYNGQTYNFNINTVAEYMAISQICQQQNVHLIMVVKNTYNPATLDLIYPQARQAGMRAYGFNISEPSGVGKITALLHFLSENTAIHSWIIGNEVNNNYDWHWSGRMSAQAFGESYAKEVRLCYNAIKSVNANANVYINLDQRWNFEDGTHDQYGGKKVLDAFNNYILTTGNIDWGLSFHPHSVPLTNCRFWNIPSNYKAMGLVSNSENSKMITMTNMSVVTNYMTKAQFLSPYGKVRHMMISEMLFTSSNPTYTTNEQIQAASMVYGYKLMAAQPAIEAVIIHRHVDDASEIGEGMACGIRNVDGTPKFSYEAFKYMDQPGSSYSDFALPIIGASSWAQLGLN